MKPFDDKFAENVREVFDNYQEPVDEKAWVQMKSRLQNKPRVILFPIGWVKAAAAIALLVISSVFFWQIFWSGQLSETELALDTSNGDAATTIPLHPEESQPEAPAERSIQHMTEESISIASNGDRIIVSDKTLPAETPLAKNLYEESKENADIVHAHGMLAEENQVTVLPEPEEVLPVKTDPVSSVEVATRPVVTAKSDEEIIRENLAWQEPADRDRSGGFEVSAGSLKTWSPNELAGGIGFSAGVTGSWDLTSNLSLASGGLLVYNQFSLADASTGMNRTREDYNYIPNIDGADNIHSLQEQTSAEFEFYAIDVPMNVRYKISETSSAQWFLSAGFSSFIYLQQNYTQRTEFSAMYTGESFSGYRTANITETSAGNVDAFRRIDFARLLNLSAGYVVRRENYAMIIEPYVKVPVASITSLDLDIGMAGLSLKYQFGKR